MYNVGTSPVTEDHIENILIPEGDPGEQLVANLILSVIVCQLTTLPNAIAYVAKAHELAVRLQSQTIMYHPKSPAKFARAEFELHSTNKILLFSLINNVLVMPPIGSAELAKVAATAGLAINLKNLDVARFMLRLRPRRLAVALEPLKTFDDPERFTDVTGQILAKCFYREIISEEPLNRADDLFMLARALIRKRNFQMAALALKNADGELELYVRSTPLEERPPTVQRMKDQIAEILKELGSGAV
jgi:hypothetical protein